MGGQQSRTVGALDRLTGGLLLASAATGHGFALSLFDPKGELAKLSADLVRGLGERLRGLDRFTRTERLAAAHSVLAVGAYFETLSRVGLPFDARADTRATVSLRTNDHGDTGVLRAPFQ
jgi:hypothetical protein